MASVIFTRARALLFDFDGTLITQRIDFGLMRRQVLRLVGSYGIDPAPLQGVYVLELIDLVRERLEVEAVGSGAEFARAAQQAVLDIELAAAENAQPLPGVAQMLATLQAWGYGVGIVTRNCRPAVERVLRIHQLHYDVLLTRDDVPYVKPDPRHLLAAVQVLGVDGPATVMCGDHPMDVLAGQRIAAATVGVLPEGQGDDYFSQVGPDVIVARAAQVLDHLPRSQAAQMGRESVP